MTEPMQVGIYALLTALATGIGAVPFFFIKQVNKQWLGLCTALAAGGMLGASWLLTVNGVHHSVNSTVVGAGIGLLFIIITQELLKRAPHLEVHHLPTADVKKMLLIVIIMTVHSFAEGVGIGVAFGDGVAFGVLIALALAIHNIPEGLAISLVLYPRGVSALQCVGWSIFSSLPQLLAIPAFLFVEHVHRFLPIGLGFAAGAMVWMVVSELLPDARKYSGLAATTTTVLLGFVGMVLLEKAV